MKLFSAAVLATAVTANLQGEYSKLARGKKSLVHTSSSGDPYFFTAQIVF